MPLNEALNPIAWALGAWALIEAYAWVAGGALSVL